MLLFGGVGHGPLHVHAARDVVVEGGLPQRLQQRRQARMLDDHQGSFHPLRLRPHRQHHRQRVRAAERAVRHHRARSRARAGGDRRRAAGGRGRRQPRGRAEARRHRARARPDRGGRHRRRERLHGAERAGAAARPLHRRPRRNRGRRAQAEARRRRSRRSRRTRSARVQMAQTALRPAVVDFVQLATSSDNLDLAMEQITVEASSPLVGPVAARREPAPAIRRDRRRHPARRTGAWSSIPSRTP